MARRLRHAWTFVLAAACSSSSSTSLAPAEPPAAQPPTSQTPPASDAALDAAADAPVDAPPPPTPIDPTALGPFAEYVGADAMPESGTTLATWPDRIARGPGDLVSAGTGAAYVASNPAFAGRATVVLGDGQALANGDPTRWTFLHDGTSYLAWYVGRSTGASVATIFDTNAGTEANPGVGFFFDLSAPGRELVDAFSDATGAAAQFRARRTRKGLVTGAPMIMMIRHVAGEGLRIRVDGVEELADAPIGAYGTAAPARGLYLGQDAELAELGFVKSAVSLADVARVELFLSQRYGIALPPSSGRRAIFWCGDSLMSNGQAFPDNVRSMLSATNLAEHLLGVDGSDTTQMLVRDPARVDAFFDPASENIAVTLEGMNDVRDGATVAQAIDHMKSWSLARRAVGFKVVIVGMTPNNLVTDADRAVYNAALDSGVGVWFDALAPIHHDAVMGQDGQNADTTYYVDGRHLTAAGDAILAKYVAAALNALP